MSGHSKWSKVKHIKAIKDPRRGKLFSRLSQQIRVAAREGGPDPEVNAALRAVIEEAKAANLPKENIQRAINKGAGIGETGLLENITLEGYGPGGVAFLIQASTDNRNRTVQEMRYLFDRNGGSLGEPGSAAYVFGNDPQNPSFKTPITNAADRKQLESLIEVLGEQEDVDEVFHNLGGFSDTGAPGRI